MSIKVLFFASLREQIGTGHMEVEACENETALALWQRITQQNTLPGHIRIAMNQAYCEPHTIVTDGTEIAFFPPVTGG